MRVMDRQYMKTPFYGAGMMLGHLLRSGYAVNIKRVRRLYRLMGLEAICPKPDLSKPEKSHKKYPYLLRNVAITHSNHVWSSDITYIPMPDGFLYLTAVMDWHSRFVLSWELSNSLDTYFCMEAVRKAIEKYGKPLIFNTDQGSQFTSLEYTRQLSENGISISMDGRGRATDNAFVERLWRTLKYEFIYLNAIEDGLSLYKGLETYFEGYNFERPHSSLRYRSPAQLYLP